MWQKWCQGGAQRIPGNDFFSLRNTFRVAYWRELFPRPIIHPAGSVDLLIGQKEKSFGQKTALSFLLFFQISIADTLLGIVAPLEASEIEFRVGDPRVTFFTASSDIVLEEFCGGAANGAADLKNVFFFPVARILSRTFHRVFILSLSLPYCNGTRGGGEFFIFSGDQCRICLCGNRSECPSQRAIC